MKGTRLILAILAGAAIMSSGCSDGSIRNELQAEKARSAELAQRVTSLEGELESVRSSSKGESLIYCASDVATLLKEKDMKGLARYVHPEKGLRMTPYPNVNVENDRVYTADELVSAFGDSKAHVWGSYDGSGEDIELTFEEYFADFVYDADFINPGKIGYDESVSSGNVIDNVKEAYPEGRFVEFYHNGTKKYSYMDWSSIKAVFEEREGKWYLVGLIHGQWTI